MEEAAGCVIFEPLTIKKIMEQPIVGVTTPVPTGNDKIWSILCHVSYFIGVPLLLPLVVYLAMRNESEFVAANAREALNFHISLLLYSLICIPLAFIIIGIFLWFAILIVGVVFAIIATVKTSGNEIYRYPLTIRLVK